ncbi:MAG: LssY C-terminal domain-containing protein, partial [Terrimicrobiaceae bacterium]
MNHWLILILVAWAIAAYLLIPWLWKLYFRHHFTDTPRITQTSDGHPGDPVNIAIEGEEGDLVRAMHEAGWYPADPITLASSVRIVVD